MTVTALDAPRSKVTQEYAGLSLLLPPVSFSCLTLSRTVWKPEGRNCLGTAISCQQSKQRRVTYGPESKQVPGIAQNQVVDEYKLPISVTWLGIISG